MKIYLKSAQVEFFCFVETLGLLVPQKLVLILGPPLSHLLAV